MTTWSTTTLVRVADDYDREMGDSNASLDSRFGRYLTQRFDGLACHAARFKNANRPRSSCSSSDIEPPGVVPGQEGISTPRSAVTSPSSSLISRVEGRQVPGGDMPRKPPPVGVHVNVPSLVRMKRDSC
ncbi:hypothetical protein [Streptomyces sp. NPDC058371]|uniref:hypothetical protein n=1 Tax=Streptomyces sp. NPDC058371 TaxID=3346463 RepID=UPI00364AAE13